MDLSELTIVSAHQLLLDKKISAPELVRASLARVKSLEPKLHAFLLVTEAKALQQAEAAQRVINRQKEFSPLLGIPMAHKDVYCTEGVATTAASNILQGYVPPYSATAVARLSAAGAVCVGKLNCDAFAHGSSTENSDCGPTRNPYNLEYVPGGSSGGSAAAVAASEVLFSTGTDTGGSLRLPACFTNTVGLKPTYGRVSRYGIIAMASSTDSPGPLTKTVEDCACVLSAMAGYDPCDATSSKRPVPDYASLLGREIQGWKVGVPKEFFGEGLDAQVAQVIRAAIDKFQALGAEISEVIMPNLPYALAVYYIVMPSEVASNLARYDGIKYGYSVERLADFAPRDLLEVYQESRGRGFGAEAKRRIMLGTYALSSGYYDAYYKKALQARELIRRDFSRAFEKCDLLLAPVSPTPPFKLGEKAADPLAMYLSDIYTVSVNLAGNPAVSLPAGFINVSPASGAPIPRSGQGSGVGVPQASELPVGLQIIGAPYAEDKIFQAAYVYEQATLFYKKKPNIK